MDICSHEEKKDHFPVNEPSSKVWQMSYKFIRHFGMKKL